MNIFLPANSKSPTCVLRVQKNKSLQQRNNNNEDIWCGSQKPIMHPSLIHSRSFITTSSFHYFLIGTNSNGFSFSLSLCKNTFLRNHLRYYNGQHQRMTFWQQDSQLSESSFQPLEPRKRGIWLVFTAGSQHPSNSLIFLLCFIACAAIFHTSLAPNLLLSRPLSSHSPSLLLSDSFFFPSLPSLIQQTWLKHLLLQNTASLSLSVTLPYPFSSLSKASLDSPYILCAQEGGAYVIMKYFRLT